MAAFVEPTVFAKDFKCGDELKPKNAAGSVVKRTVACKVPSQRRNVGRGNLARTYDWKFFEKRDGQEVDCASLLRSLTKRHGPEEDEMMTPIDAPVPVTAPQAVANPIPAKGTNSGSEPPAVASPVPAKGPTGSAPPKTDGVPKDTASLAQPAKGNEAPDVSFDTSKPWEWGIKTGFSMPALAQVVDSFNKITVEKGKGAYARISAGMYNERLFNQAHENGLMTLGAQHGVSNQ
jgi:hypothetical protein